MKASEQLKALLIKNPDINLASNNGCIFRAPASVQTPKSVTQTVKKKPGIGVGIGIPVIGNLGIGIGKTIFGGKATVKTQTVYSKTPCTFYMTLYSFIIKTAEGNLTLDFDDMKGIEMHKDGMVLKCGPAKYEIIMKSADVKRFMQTYELVGKAGREGMKPEDLLR